MKDFREWAQANVDAVLAAAEGQPIEYKCEGKWHLMINGPFDTDVQYRRKPKMIQIGEYQVPEPMRKAPPEGTTVYYPLILQGEVGDTQWMGSDDQLIPLKFGVCHSSLEAAQLHLDALLAFTRMPDSEANK